MKKAVYILFVLLICLVVAGCGARAAPPEVAPTDTPVEAPAPTAVPAEPTPESTAVPPEPTAESPTPTPEPPTPTNTLVVPQTPTHTPLSEPTSAPTPPPAETPIPTAEVAPEWVELAEWAQGVEDEVLQPVEEMATTLDELIPDSGVPDIRTFCTGVEVVLDTLRDVQQGLDEVGPPPTDDPDLQECWAEFNLGVDDLQQGLQLIDSSCETFNVADLQAGLAYLESGAQHMENAGEAFERWENRMGF